MCLYLHIVTTYSLLPIGSFFQIFQHISIKLFHEILPIFKDIIVCSVLCRYPFWTPSLSFPSQYWLPTISLGCKLLFFYYYYYFKYILLGTLLQLSHFPPFIPLHPVHPLPPTFPAFSSCPWIIYISSLASPFPILFLTSPIDFVPTNYAAYSMYLFPHSPLPPPH